MKQLDGRAPRSWPRDDPSPASIDRRRAARRAALPPNAAVDSRAARARAVRPGARRAAATRRRNWGDSSAIQATFGWIYNQRGDLRAGINAMKRAYPQYMAAGGESCRPTLLKVLFPVDYWPLIRRYSAEHNLDPYMVAALDRAGVDVHRRRAIVGERLRPDAAPAVDRPPVREVAAAAETLLDSHADDGRDQHPDGHRVLRRSGAAVRRRALRARDLQRRARTASRAGFRSGPASIATSSSTTSRSPRRRTT